MRASIGDSRFVFLGFVLCFFVFVFNHFNFEKESGAFGGQRVSLFRSLGVTTGRQRKLL